MGNSESQKRQQDNPKLENRQNFVSRKETVPNSNSTIKSNLNSPSSIDDSLLKKKPGQQMSPILKRNDRTANIFCDNKNENVKDHEDRSQYKDSQFNENIDQFRASYEGKTERKIFKHNKLIIAAIDFGTTFSGLAYCTKDDKTKIYSILNSYGKRTYKIPTCMLLQPDKSLYSFGYEAEEDFANKQNETDFRSWYFFKNFKMLLYECRDIINSETVLEDEMAQSGKEKMKAVDVFAIGIEYFQRKLLQEANKAFRANSDSANLLCIDVFWILTVPGIWNIKAKQFMRDAALKAGIANDQLCLALEPEAASLYCRSLPMFIEETQGREKVISELPIGEKYIVLDQGGGTIDLTVHEVASENTLKEIHQACGGGWGSNMINKKFEALLVDVFGRNVVDQARLEDPSEYQEFLNSFETKKISFSLKPDLKTVVLKVPFTFFSQYKSIHHCEFQNGEWTNRYGDKISVSKDKLEISKKLFQEWYEDVITRIVNFMTGILEKQNFKDITTVLAVGGFSKSNVLMEKLKTKFPHLNIIIPYDAEWSVLKGAVLYAFDPNCITCRVAQCTYGISMQMPYDPIKYPDRKGIIGACKRSMIDDVFDIHVEVGQVLYQEDVPAEHEYFPTIENHTSITLEFFASSDKSPKYTNEESCSFLGVLHFDLETRSRIFVRINASGTELVAIARDEKTNKEYKGYFSLI